jgi:hypothetical protein
MSAAKSRPSKAKMGGFPPLNAADIDIGSAASAESFAASGEGTSFDFLQPCAALPKS